MTKAILIEISRWFFGNDSSCVKQKVIYGRCLDYYNWNCLDCPSYYYGYLDTYIDYIDKRYTRNPNG